MAGPHGEVRNPAPVTIRATASLSRFLSWVLGWEGPPCWGVHGDPRQNWRAKSVDVPGSHRGSRRARGSGCWPPCGAFGAVGEEDSFRPSGPGRGSERDTAAAGHRGLGRRRGPRLPGRASWFWVWCAGRGRDRVLEKEHQVRWCGPAVLRDRGMGSRTARSGVPGLRHRRRACGAVNEVATPRLALRGGADREPTKRAWPFVPSGPQAEGRPRSGADTRPIRAERADQGGARSRSTAKGTTARAIVEDADADADRHPAVADDVRRRPTDPS